MVQRGAKSSSVGSSFNAVSKTYEKSDKLVCIYWGPAVDGFISLYMMSKFDSTCVDECKKASAGPLISVESTPSMSGWTKVCWTRTSCRLSQDLPSRTFPNSRPGGKPNTSKAGECIVGHADCPIQLKGSATQGKFNANMDVSYNSDGTVKAVGSGGERMVESMIGHEMGDKFKKGWTYYSWENCSTNGYANPPGSGGVT